MQSRCLPLLILLIGGVILADTAWAVSPSQEDIQRVVSDTLVMALKET